MRNSNNLNYQNNSSVDSVGVDKSFDSDNEAGKINK